MNRTSSSHTRPRTRFGLQPYTSQSYMRILTVMVGLFLVFTQVMLTAAGYAGESEHAVEDGDPGGWHAGHEDSRPGPSGTVSAGIRGSESAGREGDAGAAALSLASWEIRGIIDSGYAVMKDCRELYNPAGGTAAVRYLFSIPEKANITGIEAASGDMIYSIHETTGQDDIERDAESIIGSGNVVFARLLGPGDAGAYLNDLVEAHSCPGFLSMCGAGLLVCDFPVEGRSFLAVEVHYLLPVETESGMNGLAIPLSSGIGFSIPSGGVDGGSEGNGDGGNGNDGDGNAGNGNDGNGDAGNGNDGNGDGGNDNDGDGNESYGSEGAWQGTGGLGEMDDVRGKLEIDMSSVYALEGIYSPTHEIAVMRNGFHEATIRWEGRPFTGEVMEIFYSELTGVFGGGLLNYRLPGMTMFRENEDGYFMFLFSPNTGEFEGQAMPKDIVFVIDCSGSMSGDKIVQARDALEGVLEALSPEDRFTVLGFSSTVSSYSQELLRADEHEIERARDWVSDLEAGGGTDINSALLDALDILGKNTSYARPREVIFLTDGLPSTGVTNNEAIVENVKERNILEEVSAALYVFGVGYDVNTNLLDRLSSDADGRTLYIEPEEDIDTVLTEFYDTIAAPVLTNISMEIDGVEVISMFPRSLPDLYRGGEMNIVGMYSFPDRYPGDPPDGGTFGEQPREYPGENNLLRERYHHIGGGRVRLRF